MFLGPGRVVGVAAKVVVNGAEEAGEAAARKMASQIFETVPVGVSMPHLKQVIATGDDQFFEHNGKEFVAFARREDKTGNGRKLNVVQEFFMNVRHRIANAFGSWKNKLRPVFGDFMPSPKGSDGGTIYHQNPFHEVAISPKNGPDGTDKILYRDLTSLSAGDGDNTAQPIVWRNLADDLGAEKAAIQARQAAESSGKESAASTATVETSARVIEPTGTAARSETI